MEVDKGRCRTGIEGWGKGMAGWAVCRAGGVQGEGLVHAYLQKPSRETEPDKATRGLEYCVARAKISFLVVLGFFLFLSKASNPPSSKD